MTDACYAARNAAGSFNPCSALVNSFCVLALSGGWLSPLLSARLERKAGSRLAEAQSAREDA